MQDRTTLIKEITALAPTLHFSGFSIGGLLGCGDYGCVFSTSRPNIVIKIGSQWSEYAFARRILDLSLKHPALPLIFEAMPLDSRFSVPSYAILREDIKDLSFPLAWLDERLADLEYELETCQSADDVYELAANILESTPGNPRDELVFEEIVELTAWCLERSIILGDMLAINFGSDINGQLKLRDLGGARILKA